ncbi:MAG: helix-turn-helix domain-containing protein [Phycisphaerales bacterium JB052]
MNGPARNHIGIQHRSLAEFAGTGTGHHSKPHAPIAVRPQQAAEMIGVSERTLRELMRQGEIPFAKLDRAVLIQVRELEAFIERRTSKGGASS